MASSRYEARRARGGSWISPSRRLAIYIRDGFCCLYCGRDRRRANDLTLDHLTCHEDGGTDAPSNLVTACRSCNSAKGCKRWRKYAPAGAIQRIINARRRRLNMPLARAIIAGRSADPRSEGRG
jgi:5-methylcytosine-specific restriction endonuclease McrA